MLHDARHGVVAAAGVQSCHEPQISKDDIQQQPYNQNSHHPARESAGVADDQRLLPVQYATISCRDKSATTRDVHCVTNSCHKRGLAKSKVLPEMLHQQHMNRSRQVQGDVHCRILLPESDRGSESDADELVLLPGKDDQLHCRAQYPEVVGDAADQVLLPGCSGDQDRPRVS